MLLGAWLGCVDDADVALVGTVERTQIELLAPVSEVITEVLMERGDAVEAGQRIVQLEPTLLTAELRRAEAAEASAEVADRLALRELRRTRELRASGVASEQTLEHAELAR